MIPPEQDSDFVAHMEQVLDVYKRVYDESNQAVCMDESPEQLVEDVACTSIEPGKEARVDYQVYPSRSSEYLYGQ